MSPCHEPACPARGVQNLPLSYPTAPHPSVPPPLPPLLSPPLPSTLCSSAQSLCPISCLQLPVLQRAPSLGGQEAEHRAARQECSEGCSGWAAWAPCPVSARPVYPTALNLLNTPNTPWRACPCHHTGPALRPWASPPALKGARWGLWGCFAENVF